MRTIRDVAQYVRSKNAGPFWVTIDLMCADMATYRELSRSNAVSVQSIAKLYGVAAESIQTFHIPTLRMIKISFPRLVPQGSARDRDCHAGQTFVPLLSVPVDIELTDTTL
jgi:hypothetical protein